MCTINSAVAALERYGGFDPKRSRTVSRALIDNGVIPMGAPGMAQVLSVEEFLFLLETLAFEPKLREARVTAARAQFLVPHGVVLPDDAPASIPRTAHQALLIYAELALGSLDDQRAVSNRRFEFVSTWPEFADHCTGGVARFVEPGVNPQAWQAIGQRRSTTLNGAAFVDLIRALFP